MTNVKDTCTVTARRWEHGWELHVEGVGVTQVATLDKAARQVRDLICTMLDIDEYNGRVVIVPETVRDVVVKLDADRARLDEAMEVFTQTRIAAMKMMKEDGFSYADIAGAVGMTKGRVSQLIGGKR